MEGQQLREPGRNGAAVTDRVEMITFVQRLVACARWICLLGSAGRRSEPDEMATASELPPCGTATASEHPPVGPTTESEQPPVREGADSEQPRHETATSFEQPPNGTGRGFEATEDNRLPKDYQSILNRMVAPVKYSSKAELYGIFRKNLLIDDSSASFTLGESGEKSFMFSSRNFGIHWIQERKHWRRMRYINSRFPEVVLLVNVCWLHLSCSFNLRDLSRQTTYSIYLVYECTDDLDGLHDTQECLITVGGSQSRREVSLGSLEEEEDDAMHRYPDMTPIGAPRMRWDEWMEVEIGELHVEECRDETVEINVREIEELDWKRGIIIEGIEFRAKNAQENVTESS